MKILLSLSAFQCTSVNSYKAQIPYDTHMAIFSQVRGCVIILFHVGLETQNHHLSESLLLVSSSRTVNLQKRSLFLLAIQRTNKRRSFTSSLVLSLLNSRWQTSWPTFPSECRMDSEVHFCLLLHDFSGDSPEINKSGNEKTIIPLQ